MACVSEAPSGSNPLSDKCRFCHAIERDYLATLLREDASIYQAFINWLDKNTRAKRKQTYDDYWRRLCQYFQVCAQRRMGGDTQDQMRRV